MRYCFKVEEIIRKYVWVEADNEQEAEALALEDDLMKDIDANYVEAELVEMEG